MGLVAIIALGAFLLLYRLGGHSLSVDEYVNVQIERGTWPQMLSDLRRGEDLHPPLSHLVMNAWFRRVGESDGSARLPWSLVSVLSIYLVFRVGREALGVRAGLVAALLLATAPTFVLYSRFDKYYALTVMLHLLATLAALWLWRRPALVSAALYAVSLAALLYTDYLAPLSLMLGQALLLLVHRGDRRRNRWTIAAWSTAGLLYSPWIGMLLAQARVLEGMGDADLASGLLGLGLKLGHLSYSFLLGETIFPWRAPAIWGALGGAAMAAGGVRVLVRPQTLDPEPGVAGAVLAMALPGVLLSAALTTWLFRSVPFVAFANHVLFALPAVCLVLAAPFASRPLRWRPVAALLLLLMARGVAIGNYYAGRDFHNPIYAVPTREIVLDLVAQVRGDDIILTDPDTGVGYYYARGHQPAPLMSTTEPEAALAYLQQARPARAWLLTFGRDRTRDAVPPDVQRWLDANYHVGHVVGYAEQDALYSALKERLFGRPNYRHKLLVTRYDRPDAAPNAP
jgi:hypothetical protein